MSTQTHLIRKVFTLNKQTVGVKVAYNGWCATYNGDDCSLADIPSQYHQIIREAVTAICLENNWVDMGAVSE